MNKLQKLFFEEISHLVDEFFETLKQGESLIAYRASYAFQTWIGQEEAIALVKQSKKEGNLLLDKATEQYHELRALGIDPFTYR